ncbi:MAG TPA: hypothetical protein VFD70_08655 [Anaerolineae bacterium]|nr:hypothetical protein [Anaerolineae bacterium]
MSWLDEKAAKARRAEDLRIAQREADKKALLSSLEPKAPPRRVRKALGGKLIELGKRLQDSTQDAPARTSNA